MRSSDKQANLESSWLRQQPNRLLAEREEQRRILGKFGPHGALSTPHLARWTVSSALTPAPALHSTSDAWRPAQQAPAPAWLSRH